ncbi:MAG: hypothetical protein ACEQSH_00010 [Bacteroidia bacterium]
MKVKISEAQLPLILVASVRDDGLVEVTAALAGNAGARKLAAQRMLDKGLVETIDGDLAAALVWLVNGEGEHMGLRLTATAFESIAMDPSEWPAYIQSAAPSTETAMDLQDALEASIAAGVPAKGYGETEPETKGGPSPWTAHTGEMARKVATLAAAEAMGLDTSGIAADLAAKHVISGSPILSARGKVEIIAGALAEAAEAVVQAWDNTSAPLSVEDEMTPAMDNLRAVLAAWANRGINAPKAAKAPRTQRQPGEPKVPGAGTHADVALGLMRSADGVTCDQLRAHFGFVHKRVHGLLSGMRAAGIVFTSDKEGGQIVYRAAPVDAAAA